MHTLNDLKSLLPVLAGAAQSEYDAWQQDEDGFDEELGSGGICHLIAEGVVTVDIPPGVYESGGGYTWSKLPGVVFSEGHRRRPYRP